MANELTAHDSTKRALEQGVVAAWDREFTHPPMPDVRHMASAAVHEVVSALRWNPEWAKGLGIGD